MEIKKFYIAHPFVDRKIIRLWQQDFQKELDSNNINIFLYNPIYDSGRCYTQMIDSGEMDKSELDKDIIISQDLLQLGSSDAIIVIILTPEKTIGTYMEIAIAKTLNSSIPVYFVCPSEITRNSIWIKAFSNEIFSRTSDLNRKILQEYSF